MCDKNQLQQTTRQLQLDYQQEKDRLTDYYTSKCQKEKQQTSQKLLQKFTLDLAEARESSIKQYRLERELYEHQLQLRCHREKEDIRKDLTLKYHQEVENVRSELSREKERDLRELKHELLQNFYHYEQQIPSPISLISDVATDEKNDSAPSLSSHTLSFQEWKGKLFENEISDLTNAIRSQYAIEKQQLLTEQQSIPSFPDSLIPQHTNIWLEGNALIIGILSAIVIFIVWKWISSGSSETEDSNVSSPRSVPISRTISDDASEDRSPVNRTSPTSSSFAVIETTPKALTPLRRASFPLPPLDKQYDVFISYFHHESLAVQERIQFLATSLQQLHGYSVYLPQSQGESKERVVDAMDRSKTVLVCLTEEYHRRTSPANVGRDEEDDHCRLELNYALGALTSAKIVIAAFEEAVSKKTHWKHRFRNELYSVKPLSLLSEGEEMEGRVKDVADRIKVTMK